MKIGIFTYNFPHYKSQQGLVNLLMAEYTPDVMFAQNYKQLDFISSKLRTSTHHEYIHNPVDMGLKFNVDTIIDDHDSERIHNEIKKRDLDLGIVLGARILKKATIDCFNVGILNMHPGIIPINRGLDNIKYAVIDCIKQGVTTHLIDARVDMGAVIDIQTIDVYSDDSLVEMGARLHEYSQKMMIEAVDFLVRGGTVVPVLDEGKRNGIVPMEEESLWEARFDYYKKFYKYMKEN